MNPIVNPRCRIFKQRERDYSSNAKTFSQVEDPEENSNTTDFRGGCNIKKKAETTG